MPVFVRTFRIGLDPNASNDFVAQVQNNGVKGTSIGNEIFRVMKNLFWEVINQY